MAFDRPATPSQARSTTPEQALEVLDRAIAAAQARGSFADVARRAGIGCYRGYAECLVALRHAVGRGARLAHTGFSVEGEPLFALYLGVTDPTPRVPMTAILSGVHPSEWIGIETHLALLERIAGVDLGSRGVVSFPIVNPDGVIRVEDHLRAGRRRFVRHNARGVDLNRNFDARWGQKGIVQRVVPWVFSHGSRPFSEPEVESIAYELADLRVDRALSLHSFGGAVLFPSGSTVWPVHDAAEHREWARRIARAADPRRPYRALPCSWWAMGITAGGLELDWFHQRHGALSLLVECSRGGASLRPSRLLSPFAWFNPRDVERVAGDLASATLPFVKGLAP